MLFSLSFKKSEFLCQWFILTPWCEWLGKSSKQTEMCSMWDNKVHTNTFFTTTFIPALLHNWIDPDYYDWGYDSGEC